MDQAHYLFQNLWLLPKLSTVLCHQNQLFVLFQDGTNSAATQRAYHPDEVLKNSNLKVDVKYYLAHQVHPVAARLCEPIEGTDTARIAECLGREFPFIIFLEFPGIPLYLITFKEIPDYVVGLLNDSINYPVSW